MRRVSELNVMADCFAGHVLVLFVVREDVQVNLQNVHAFVG